MAETLTLEQARLAAHESALRTNAAYRRMVEQVERRRAEWARRTAERRAGRGHHRRIYSLDNLPMARAFMTGPKWQRYFEVREVCLLPYRCRRLMFSLAEDVRERVLEEIRPGVYAQWSDPRERFGGRS